MPTPQQHAWISSALGVNVGAIGAVTSAVAAGAAGAATVASATSAAGVAAVKGAASAAGALNGPMMPDCKPVKGKVPGPAQHLLCATHGHVLDIKEKKIIAVSLDQYNATHGKDGKAAATGTGGPKAGATGAPQAKAATSPAATGSATTTPAASAPPTAAPAASAPAGTAPAAADDNAKKQVEMKKILGLIQIQMEDLTSTLQIYEDLAGGGLLNRAVSKVSDVLGGADDPGAALGQLQKQLIVEQVAGIAAAGKLDLDEARKHVANMNAITEKARKLVMVYSGDTATGADRSVKVLKVLDKAGDIAQDALGPAGKALGVVKKTGVAAMKIHLDQPVDWVEFGVDMACDLFLDKVGGDQLAKRVTGPLTSKLVAKFGSKVSKEVIEKVAENVVKTEIKAVVKTTADGVHKVVSGKEITYEEFLSDMVDKMTDPKELLASMISSKLEVAAKQ